MKKYIYPMLLAPAFVAAACSSDIDVTNDIPDDQKEMISFSMTDAAGSSQGVSSTRAGFTAATRIVMRMRSKDASTNSRYTRTIAQANAEASGKKYSTVQFDGSYARYWDDAFGRDANISVFAVALPNKNDATLLPEAKLTGAATSTYVNGTTWFTEATESEKIDWNVTTSQQSSEQIGKEDLTYSNNIQPVVTSGTHNGYDGLYTYDFTNNKYIPELADDINNISSLGDGQMVFQLQNSGETTGAGKFNKGHLIFKHALSRITVHIRKGTGVVDGNAFAFAENTDITLKQFPVNGTLDIETGTWTLNATASTAKQDIVRMASTTSTETANIHNYYAQVLPGYQFRENGTANVMEFTIDNNTYYITQDMVYKALTLAADGTTAINTSEKKNDTNGNYVEMEQGKNYDLTITVGKKAIDALTATLVDWVNVTGTNMQGDNSYVTLSLMDATSTACSNFDLYRMDAGFGSIYTDQNSTTLPQLTNWYGNYTDKATLSSTSTTGVWKTNWFWESNKAFYHLRTVDKGMIINGTSDNTNDYINIYSGPINNTWSESGTPAVANISTAVNDLKYNDYHWGAPLKSSASALTYQTSGTGTALAYGPYVDYAIGSTKSQINIIEQHMMANVHFVLHTGTTADGNAVADAGKVALKNSDNKATQVTLTNFVGNGTVELGCGLVAPSTTASDVISSDIPVPGLNPAYTSGTKTLSSLVVSSGYYATDGTVTNAYSYRVVPQELHRGSTAAASDTQMSNFIGLSIVTPDNNQYYLIKKLYEVTASSVTTNHDKAEQTSGSQITRWYPGYDYTYHIYINKKGIEAITCSVVDWVTVTATNQDLNLEN